MTGNGQNNGALSPDIGVIDVHFNEVLDRATAENPSFYQLIYTRDTVTPGDDVIVNPTSVSYDQATNVVKLTFPGSLARLPNPNGGAILTGAARLPRSPATPGAAHHVAQHLRPSVPLHHLG